MFACLLSGMVTGVLLVLLVPMLGWNKAMVMLHFHIQYMLGANYYSF